MKAFIKSLFATTLMVASLAGCKQEMSAPEPNHIVHFKINAGSPDTKTGIYYDNGAYEPYWNNGDQLGVLFTLPTADGNLTNEAVFSNTASKGSKAVFEGDVELGDDTGITFYSYYPASSGAKRYANSTIGLDVPAAQSPIYDGTYGYSFDPAADILIAQPTTCFVLGGEAANEGDMFFARLSSIFRIALTSANSTAFYGEVVKSFTVEVSSGDIAGRIVVNPSTGEYVHTNNVTGSKSITATYNTSDCPVYVGYDGTNNVFLSVAPTTIPAGSSLTFTIKTVNASTGEDAHTLVKTVPSTPSAIPFECSKPTVISLTLTDENISNTSIEYTLVKDVAELTVGSEVIIAAAGFAYALGTTQNTNNRAAASQEKSADSQTIAGPSASVQLLTITAGNLENTIAFSTGDGYLFAASSSSNWLRTEENLSNNSSWAVSIDSESGVASLTAQGTYTHNILKYNSGSACFACYTSGQQDVAIYKRSTPDDRTAVTLSFATASYNLSVGSSEYSSFEGQTVTTTPVGVTGVTYALTGDAIGTVVSGTGVVTLNGTEGTATVTASFAGNKDYKPAASVSYTITVDDPSVVDYVTLDWTYPAGDGSATSSDLSLIDGVTTSGLGSDYAAGNAPYQIKFDSTGDFIQIKTDSPIDVVSIKYKKIAGAGNSKVTLSESEDGSVWNEVEELTFTGAQNYVGTVESSTQFDNDSRFVKIVFTKVSDNIAIGGISITKPNLTPRFTVDSPLAATAAADDYNVSITRKYFDGAINVAVPNGYSWITADNVSAGGNTVSVHVAANTGSARSVTLTLSGEGVASQELVVNQAGSDPGTEANPYTVAQALSYISGLNGATSSTVWVRGIVSTIESYNSQYHSIYYYISDNGSQSNELYVYSGKGVDGANFNDITDLAVGDEIVIKGTVKEYNSTPEFTQSSQIVSITPTTRYTVTLGSVTNGTISASATSVGAQGIVTLTATPNSGYALDSWSVYKTGDQSTTVTVTNNQFTMPAYGVTVSATFVEEQGEPHYYELVTDVTTLSAGDKILIINTNHDALPAFTGTSTISPTDLHTSKYDSVNDRFPTNDATVDACAITLVAPTTAINGKVVFKLKMSNNYYIVKTATSGTGFNPNTSSTAVSGDWTLSMDQQGRVNVKHNLASATRSLIWRSGSTNKFAAYATTNVNDTEYYNVYIYKLN